MSSLVEEIVALIAGASFVTALALTWWIRRIACLRGIMDRPNSRSSHLRPTPRGGGLAIVAASSVGISGLAFCGIVDVKLMLALLGGGLPIACVGFADDRRPVPARVRFLFHVAAAIWAMYVLGGLPPIQVGNATLDSGIAGDVLGALAIVWTLNLFNFMDGIDGIAASEAVFVATAGAIICFIGGMSLAVPAAALVVAAASLGFLVWNWPPAKIFMGDVGSGYLGYALAVLALGAARDNAVALYVWLTLGGVFFVDATVTLVRRLLRGERVTVAHRSHAYQWLARRWKSHGRVTRRVWLMNLIWLLPFAEWCMQRPELAREIIGMALGPLTVYVIVVGAGRPEQKESQPSR